MAYSDNTKVEELIRNVDRLAEDVKRWQYRQERSYSSSLESLKNRVDDIGSVMENMVSRVSTYDDLKRYTSQSPVEAGDMPVLEHLKFRVSHLERWVSQLDDKFKKDSSIARKQFVISLTTLIAVAAFIGVTIWFQLNS
jgi:hypothetical protein